MRQNLRKTLILVLGLVLLISVSVSVFFRVQKLQSSKNQEDAQEIVSVEPPPEPEEEVVEEVVEIDPYIEALREIDLAALQAVNEDVIGWITIPDTQLSYPIMYSGDNSYYLTHTWDKQYNSAGSVFLEQHCSPDLSDFNTILYGHRMRDGSIFGSLRDYAETSHWEQHPYIYVCNAEGFYRYEIFSIYEASVKGSTYRLALTEPEEQQAFLDDCTGWSTIETGVVPTLEDRILTLSTCTGRGYDTRWVVQARLSPDGIFPNN